MIFSAKFDQLKKPLICCQPKTIILTKSQSCFCFVLQLVALLIEASCCSTLDLYDVAPKRCAATTTTTTTTAKSIERAPVENFARFYYKLITQWRSQILTLLSALFLRINVHCRTAKIRAFLVRGLNNWSWSVLTILFELTLIQTNMTFINQMFIPVALNRFELGSEWFLKNLVKKYSHWMFSRPLLK